MSDAPARVRDFVLSCVRGEGAPPVIGLCGAQGSGKSTVTAAVTDGLAGEGLRCAVLSLDDLYLGHAARAVLALEVHPLFATRGVPGTHDVALGRRVLDALAAGEAVRLPRFDKARDAPEPEACWPLVECADVVLFEGWCVGAAPQGQAALELPVNALEADEDRTGVWRRAVDAALGGAYAALFARIDGLVLLAAPGFEVVARWRREQEHALRARLAREGRGLERTMDDAATDRFVAHFERLTRHILAEMPARADLVLRLDADRRVLSSIAPPPAEPRRGKASSRRRPSRF